MLKLSEYCDSLKSEDGQFPIIHVGTWVSIKKDHKSDK